MALAGGGLAGVSLTEAYAMRALHKEKMKKLEKQKAAENGVLVADDEKKTPNGCFFWVSKKSHSAKVSSAYAEPKLQVGGKWNTKS